MPARTERYLPERMNSFIQAGVRAGSLQSAVDKKEISHYQAKNI